MKTTTRRYFLGAAAAAAPALRSASAQRSPNDRINVAVVGFHGRGRSHIGEFAKIPNVKVAALCDADERLFPGAVKLVEKVQGHTPDTFADFRKLIERKDIDAVSIATPDYWHALMTVWACQAGKDVYVEKPCSFTVLEGRKQVEAARKYKRIVQVGLNNRSEEGHRAAMKLLNDGKLGRVYRAKATMIKPRGSIGHVQESSIPQGVNWDLYLGPSPYRAFTLNRFHYAWHFVSETSTTDVGNTGVHYIDALRWGLGQKTHPVKIHSTGGYYIWDSDQDTPNVQLATFEYADKSILDFEANNLYAPPVEDVTTYFTNQGYLAGGRQWRAASGKFEPRAGDVSPSGVNERATNASFPKAQYTPVPIEPTGEPKTTHFANFIDCMRSRKVEDLHCDILEGHLSSALCHLANISYKLGRKLVFDPKTEKFVNDKEADALLTRKYREPYVMPERV